MREMFEIQLCGREIDELEFLKWARAETSLCGATKGVSDVSTFSVGSEDEYSIEIDIKCAVTSPEAMESLIQQVAKMQANNPFKEKLAITYRILMSYPLL